MKYKLIINKEAEEEVIAIVHAPGRITEEIENLVLSYEGMDKITGISDNCISQLHFSDIECLTVMERKIIAIDKQGTRYRISQRLCELEKILPSYFIRINKSTLANKNRILRFETVFSGAVNAVFQCGYKEYVSRRCFTEMKRRLTIS